MTDLIIDISNSLIGTVGIQLLYASVIFAISYPIIFALRNKRPDIVSVLCWLTLGRLFVPVDSASPYSLRALWDNVFAARTDVIENIGHEGTALPAIITEKVSATAQPAYIKISIIIWCVLAMCYWLKGLNQRRLLRQKALVHCKVTPIEVVQLFVATKALFKITRPVKLVISQQATFAYTLGSLRPLVVLPADTVSQLNREGLNAIVAHELAHVARWDDLKICILLIIRSIFFFFPVVWWCQHYLTLAREQACDRVVLRITSMPAKTYGTNLLRAIEVQCEPSNSQWVSSLTPFSSMQARLKHLYLSKNIKNSRPITRLSIFCCAAALIWPMASYQNSVQASTPSFSGPVKNGRLSSAFGLRESPTGGKPHFHNGVDIAGSTGDGIFAVATGQVIEAHEYSSANMPDWGNYIVIAHAGGMQSRYIHLENITVKTGESIEGGSLIGTMGATGKATGPHLHLEIMKNQDFIDPSLLIAL